MKINLKCAINISEENGTATIEEILEKIQEYLRQKQNVALGRVAFEERRQEVDESFDSFYVAIRKLADEGDICNNCYEQPLVTRNM